MRAIALIIALTLAGCTTTSPNPFSGPPMIQFPYGDFVITWSDATAAYAVAKYIVTQECATKARSADQCEILAAADARIVAAADNVKTSIRNPAYPVDWSKVQVFLDEVMNYLVKVGVKGVTGGVL